MRLLISLVLLILFSCNTNEEKNTSDSPKAQVIVKNNAQVIKSNNNEEDIYIGHVGDFYFSENPEIYTELYFKHGIKNWETYDSVAKLATEIIYQDEENSRHLLHENIARKKFDIRGLHQVWFFDKDNNQLDSVTKIKTYEFLSQTINSTFIAVYATKLKAEQIAYCIGGYKPEFSQYKFEKIVDSSIITEVTDVFNSNKIQTSYTLNFTQYALNNSAILTLSNTNDYSFIHLTTKNRSTTKVFENDQYSNITGIQIIPILKEGMPILLCQFMAPETDFFWSEVLVFTDHKYIRSENQRIKLN